MLYKLLINALRMYSLILSSWMRDFMKQVKTWNNNWETSIPGWRQQVLDAIHELIATTLTSLMGQWTATTLNYSHNNNNFFKPTKTQFFYGYENVIIPTFSPTKHIFIHVSPISNHTNALSIYTLMDFASAQSIS